MSDEELRVLDFAETDDIFIDGGVEGWVRLSREQPVTGELMVDANGDFFLSPCEEYRGGGMGAVRIHKLPFPGRYDLLGKVVKVSGVYNQSAGLIVDTVASDDDGGS